jgi:aarF domain-containing kinase
MVIYCGQVDLTLEAAHLQRFIYNFRKWKNVSFPVPIYPFVHPTVLVETFEEGQTVANFVDTGPLSSVHSRLAYIGSSCLLKMLLVSTSIMFEDSLFFPA